MGSYNKANAARELQHNPLLQDLLLQLQKDIFSEFPHAEPEKLQTLQLKYRLVEELGTMIDNALIREAGEVV